MPVVMSMHWPEATLDQYEQVRKIVGWEKSEVAARVINESINRYQERYHQVGT